MLRLKPKEQRLVVFTAEVVDSIGEGVAGESVQARYFLGDGSMLETRVTTDHAGRADFVDSIHTALNHIELRTRHGHLTIPNPATLDRAVIET